MAPVLSQNTVRALQRIQAATDELTAATVALVESVSSELSIPLNPRTASVTAIAYIVATEYLVDIRRMYGATRVQPIALARQVTCALARELTDLTLHDVGTAFGLTHGGVLRACQTVANRRDTDRRFAQRYDRLRIAAVNQLRAA